MARSTARLSLLLLSLIATLAVPILATPPFDTSFLGKIVVFLYASTPNGDVDKSTPVGTGFLVRVPHKADSDFTIIMLTARHIVDPEWVHCPRQFNPDAIYARLNTVDAKAQTRYIKLLLKQEGHTLWFRHPKDDVDAAALAMPLSQADIQQLDFRALPVWRFPTETELAQVSIGDDIVSAGMLLDLKTTARNYPVFKFGKVANIPDEDVQTGCGGIPTNINAWLIGANLVPGNSGSPIFYFPPFGENGDMKAPGLQRMILLGIQSSSNVPSDIAYMTPASFVFEIIKSMKIADADLFRGAKETK